jgi:hypothetical protein
MGENDPTFDGFQPPKSSWGRSRPSRRKRDRVLAACRSRRRQAVVHDVRQNQLGGREGQHGNHQGTTQTTKVGDSSGSCRRVSERTARSVCEVHRLHSVIRHHGGAESPFKRDDEFKAWLGQQPSNGKTRELKGGGLTETA